MNLRNFLFGKIPARTADGLAPDFRVIGLYPDSESRRESYRKLAEQVLSPVAWALAESWTEGRASEALLGFEEGRTWLFLRVIGTGVAGRPGYTYHAVQLTRNELSDLRGEPWRLVPWLAREVRRDQVVLGNGRVVPLPESGEPCELLVPLGPWSDAEAAGSAAEEDTINLDGARSVLRDGLGLLLSGAWGESLARQFIGQILRCGLSTGGELHGYVAGVNCNAIRGKEGPFWPLGARIFALPSDEVCTRAPEGFRLLLPLQRAEVAARHRDEARESGKPDPILDKGPPLESSSRPAWRAPVPPKSAKEAGGPAPLPARPEAASAATVPPQARAIDRGPVPLAVPAPSRVSSWMFLVGWLNLAAACSIILLLYNAYENVGSSLVYLRKPSAVTVEQVEQALDSRFHAGVSWRLDLEDRFKSLDGKIEEGLGKVSGNMDSSLGRLSRSLEDLGEPVALEELQLSLLLKVLERSMTRLPPSAADEAGSARLEWPLEGKNDAGGLSRRIRRWLKDRPAKPKSVPAEELGRRRAELSELLEELGDMRRDPDPRAAAPSVGHFRSVHLIPAGNIGSSGPCLALAEMATDDGSCRVVMGSVELSGGQVSIPWARELEAFSGSNGACLEGAVLASDGCLARLTRESSSLELGEVDGRYTASVGWSVLHLEKAREKGSLRILALSNQLAGERLLLSLEGQKVLAYLLSAKGIKSRGALPTDLAAESIGAVGVYFGPKWVVVVLGSTDGMLECIVHTEPKGLEVKSWSKRPMASADSAHKQSIKSVSVVLGTGGTGADIVALDSSGRASLWRMLEASPVLEPQGTKVLHADPPAVAVTLLDDGRAYIAACANGQLFGGRFGVEVRKSP